MLLILTPVTFSFNLVPGYKNLQFRNLRIYVLSFFVIVLLFIPINIIAQQHDSTYIESHIKDFTLKFSGGYKFAGYKLDQKKFTKALVYKSNDNFNIGIGFSYRYLGLNLAIVMPFINNDNTRYGKTKMFDLQSFIYTRKYAIDIYSQFYTGYYLKNSSILSATIPDDKILIRPDLKTRALGFNIQYIFNYRHFSYRAAYVQNEYQKKSAGSALAGIGLHHYRINADSAIIPVNISDKSLFNNSHFNRSQVICLAINAGYAYTLVLEKHYFLTTALIGGLGINTTSLTDDLLNSKDKKTNWQINGTLRLAAGYNSSRYFAGVQYIHSLIKNTTPLANSWQEFETGFFKLTIAKRFGVKKDMIKEVYNNTVQLK